jgi:nitroimidazol reductase NimA-like FMN-containing flavoprotein (pyridoxamine 5'-phosphate oxidase superfamily)
MILLHPPVTRPASVSELSETQCRELLEVATVARVGFVSPEGLQIIPLSCRFRDGVLYLRTRPDSQLDQLAEAGRPVAFEVDYHGADFGLAWSVLMQGHVEQLDASGRRLMDNLPVRVRPWPGDDCTRGLRFIPRTYTGRRVVPPTA